MIEKARDDSQQHGTLHANIAYSDETEDDVDALALAARVHAQNQPADARLEVGAREERAGGREEIRRVPGTPTRDSRREGTRREWTDERSEEEASEVLQQVLGVTVSAAPLPTTGGCDIGRLLAGYLAQRFTSS